MTLAFPLAQGWSKGLEIVFHDKTSSRGLDLNNFFHVKQVHGRDIIEVTEGDLRKNPLLGEADGLMARGAWFKKSLRGLLVKSADCCPLFYVDRENEVVVALHAGWRGLAQGIHRRPFEEKWMDPKVTWVWLGPSLNGEDFEVEEDMWKNFPRHFMKSEFFTPHGTQKHKKLFQCWKFLEDEFRAFGVPLFYNSEVNTFRDLDYNSYRRDKLSPMPLNYSCIAVEFPRT